MSEFEGMNENEIKEEPVLEVTAEETKATETPVTEEATETPVEESTVQKQKKKTPFIIAASLIGVALIAIFAAAVCIFNGVFANKGDKVLLAISNTFDESSQMFEGYVKMCELIQDSYTMNVELEAEGMYMDFTYTDTEDENQLSGSISMEDVPEIDFLASLTGSQVKAQVPILSDYVFTYNYTTEKNGYFANMMGEETMAMVDYMCQTMYSPESIIGDPTTFAESLLNEYNSLVWEAAEKKKYDVDGTERLCAAYKTTITKENIKPLLDAWENVYSAEYLAVLEQMGADTGNAFDELRDELEYMPNIDAVFYIYKNKLACLNLEYDEAEIEFLFNNGADGMLDMEIRAAGESLLKLNGTVEGSVECYEFSVSDYDSTMTVAFKYNTENNDIEMFMESDGESFAFRGSMYSDSETATLEFDEIEMYGETVEMLCAITIQKDTTLQEFVGEEFDIGNATEDECTEVLMEIYSSLY